MKRSAEVYSACQSVFREGAQPLTVERYTQLWIHLINQCEREKQLLSASR